MSVFTRTEWFTLQIAITYSLNYSNRSIGNQTLFQAKTMDLAQRDPLVLIEFI